MIDDCGMIGHATWKRTGNIATVFNGDMMEPCHLQPNDTIDLTWTRTVETTGEIITTKYPTYTWTGKKFTSSFDKPSPLNTLTNKTLDFDDDKPKYPSKTPWWKK